MSPNFTRCNGCRERIAFFGSPFTGKPRAFEPRPVDSRTYPGVAYPVMSGRAYRFTDLFELLWPQREQSREETADEVRDLPHHVLHECRERSDDT